MNSVNLQCGLCKTSIVRDQVFCLEPDLKKNHRFHETCIADILNGQLAHRIIPSCPFCKYAIRLIDPKKVPLGAYLIDAVSLNDLFRCQMLLSCGKISHAWKTVALKDAASQGHIAILRELDDAEISSVDWETALNSAASHGQTNSISEITKSKPISYQCLATAICSASNNGQWIAVRQLLANHDPNHDVDLLNHCTKDSFQVLLGELVVDAARKNQLERMVRLLLNKTDILSSHRGQAVEEVAKRGYVRMIPHLFADGPIPAESLCNSLCLAAKNGHAACIRQLQPNFYLIPHEYFETALFEAAGNNDLHSINEILVLSTTPTTYLKKAIAIAKVNKNGAVLDKLNLYCSSSSN